MEDWRYISTILELGTISSWRQGNELKISHEQKKNRKTFSTHKLLVPGNNVTETRLNS
jgi:hypothetical protein